MNRLTNLTIVLMLAATTATVGCDIGASNPSGTMTAALEPGEGPPAGEGAVPGEIGVVPVAVAMQAAVNSVLSPDLLTRAFIADLDETGRFDLYSQSCVEGASPVRLTGLMTIGGDVLLMTWMPDSHRILFLADMTVDNEVQAWIVDANGLNLTQLSSTLVAGGDIYAMGVAGNGEWVVCAGDGEVNGHTDYYAARSNGGAWICLNTVPLPGDELNWWINADNSVTILQLDGSVSTTDLTWLPAAVEALGEPMPRVADLAAAMLAAAE